MPATPLVERVALKHREEGGDDGEEERGKGRMRRGSSRRVTGEAGLRGATWRICCMEYTPCTLCSLCS